MQSMCYKACKSDKSQLTKSFPAFENAKNVLCLPHEQTIAKENREN